MKKKVVFGLGSGRCGSASLAYLLNEQKGALVGHEMAPVLPWVTTDLTGIQFRWEQLQHQSHLYPMVGDVGIYYLPYIPMLMRSWSEVPALNESYIYKFVILKRDREEVVGPLSSSTPQHRAGVPLFARAFAAGHYLGRRGGRGSGGRSRRLHLSISPPVHSWQVIRNFNRTSESSDSGYNDGNTIAIFA